LEEGDLGVEKPLKAVQTARLVCMSKDLFPIRGVIQILHAGYGKLVVISCLSKPENNASGSFIYIQHSSDLVVSFLNAISGDTNGIYP
jgi:hypothetical protein